MQMKLALANIELFRSIRFNAPKETASEQAASALKMPPVAIDAKPPQDIDEITARIRLAFKSGTVPVRADLRHAPWCIWGGSIPLANDADVMEAYLRHVRNSGRKGDFRRLAAAYVVTFPTRSNALEAVVSLLKEMASLFTGPWTEASVSLGIFEPEAAPRRIASAAMVKGVSPPEVLSENGLRGLSLESGLAEAAFLDGLRQISELTLDPLVRLGAVQTWTGGQAPRRRFEVHRGQIADALVLPHESPMPEKQARDRMLSFLLGRFGDPRINENSWAPMQCRPIVKRWLIEQSLRQFLDIVGRIALADHWKYRGAFWSAVYDKGLISDACVIFDTVGEYHAERMFGEETPYSKWASGGKKVIERGHSCLLLRIGRGLVAEWSHNGRCNIWRDANDPTAPKLHKKFYNSSEVMIGRADPAWERDAFTHSWPRTYNWQNTVADEIYAMTGTRLMSGDYEVDA